MRIFVGGLPRSATKDDVVRLFRQFGADDAGVVLPRDRRTRRRKGVAYVELPDRERAQAAIALFTGFEIDGKPLTVAAADERPAKRSRRKLAALLAACTAAALSSGRAVNAADSSTALGLTLNPVLSGVHQSYNDRLRVPPLPIPLIELRHRRGPFELDLEALPPLAAVSYEDAIQGRTSTRLSIFDGFARVWDPLHRFSVGVGQTLYNQSTHYANAVEIARTGETQFSRVTGVTYSAGYDAPYGRGYFEAVFTYAPALRGVQYTTYDVAFYHPRVDPEKADQIDTAVRYAHPAGPHAEVTLGLRYVNYTAYYDEPPGGLSDRNVGLLAVLGYRVHSAW